MDVGQAKRHPEERVVCVHVCGCRHTGQPARAWPAAVPAALEHVPLGLCTSRKRGLAAGGGPARLTSRWHHCSPFLHYPALSVGRRV